MLKDYLQIHSQIDYVPHWFELPMNESLYKATNEQLQEKIGWQNILIEQKTLVKQFKGLITQEKIGWQNILIEQKTLVKQFKGLITEINGNIVTIVFKNIDSGIGEAYQFNIDKFEFDINVNDFVLLKQYDMTFEFEKYNETFLEKIEDRKFANKISSYEENYDI